MANWEESICLSCGSLMNTEPCGAFPDVPSWLDEYPPAVKAALASWSQEILTIESTT
jgi:hypothetical protein